MRRTRIVGASPPACPKTLKTGGAALHAPVSLLVLLLPMARVLILALLYRHAAGRAATRTAS